MTVKEITKKDDDYNIKMFKLKNGDVIICNVIKSDSSKLLIDSPMELSIKKSQLGNQILFIPWLPIEAICDNQCELKIDDILTPLVPRMKVMMKFIEVSWTVRNYLDEKELLEIQKEFEEDSISIN